MMSDLVKCSSPVCNVKFEPSGLDIKPKRFCCADCKMDVWAIRRVARAYGLDAETVYAALSKIKKWVGR